MRARKWMSGGLAVLALATVVVSCGGTGGGGGDKGGDEQQFILNSNNSGRLNLNVSPGEVDANKSDRIGLVATLSDSQGRGISGVTITFFSDIDDITFLPSDGFAVTDANGRADVIAIAGTTPTGTGAIVGTGAIFAQTPSGFGLRAQVPITLLDVGFIDSDVLGVIPTSLSVVEPAPGQVLFFNIVGGNPPYLLKNEVSGIGAAVISQHCLPGCTENGGVLCVGSPCQQDSDCNLNASPTPAGVCVGPIRRCLASCAGTNCAGSRCDTDSDCNDGSSSPANVCKDSGQSIAYIIGANPPSGTHGFVVEDSAAAAINVEVTVSFVCGNGIASGEEQCDLSDLREQTCESLGRGTGNLVCSDTCQFDIENCAFATPTPGGGGGATATPGGGGATFTPGGGVVTPTPQATPGNASALELAFGDVPTNRGGDNGNNTATSVIAATVSDSNGNPVEDGTVVSFGLTGATFGAVITAQSATGNLPPQCDVVNFEARTGVQVLEQPGVAHACVTYPIDNVGQQVSVTASSGTASDSGLYELPIALANPLPVPTATP